MRLKIKCFPILRTLTNKYYNFIGRVSIEKTCWIMELFFTHGFAAVCLYNRHSSLVNQHINNTAARAVLQTWGCHGQENNRS